MFLCFMFYTSLRSMLNIRSKLNSVNLLFLLTFLFRVYGDSRPTRKYSQLKVVLRSLHGIEASTIYPKTKRIRRSYIHNYSCMVLCRYLYVLLSIFSFSFLPSWCLFHFDLRLVITIWYLETFLNSRQF